MASGQHVGESPRAALSAADMFLQLLGQPVAPSGEAHADLDRNEMSNLGRLAHCAQSVARLKDTAWWKKGAPLWRESLDPLCMAALYCRLLQSASTGILLAERPDGATKTVAIVAGVPIAAASSMRSEQLGTFLIRRGLMSAEAASQVAILAQQRGRPAGWALLELKIMPSGILLRAQQDQIEASLQEMVTWQTGEVAFYATDEAVDLRKVIELSTDELLIRAFEPVYRQSAGALRGTLLPFFARAEPVIYHAPSSRLPNVCAEIDAALLAACKEGATPKALQARIGKLSTDAQAHALADIFTLVHCGILTFAAGASTVRLAHLSATAENAEPGGRGDALAEYRAQRDLLSHGKRLLHGYNPAEAANKLNELLRRQARPTAEVLAYLALAQLLAGDATGAQQTGVRALQAGPKDAMAHAAMARITEATGTGNGAFHRKQALGLAQNNTAWYAEVNAALAVTASDASAQARAQAGAREGLAIGLWVCTAFVLLGLFSLANVFRYGQHEYLYSGKDWLFFARRGVLAVTGLVGWCLWVGKGPVGAARELTWRLGSTQAWWIVVYGLFVGLLSPAQRVTGTWSVVLGLSVLHVLSEELFFRAFLTRMLLDQIDEARLARLVSASLYGLYHVTYFSFWQETGLQARTFYMGAIALLAGLPYAWLYGRNRSLTAPLLCHAAVSLAMMGRSILLRGWL